MWTCINDIICDLQGLVKTAKYHKRCFDQIQGISEDNKELTTEVDWLRKRLKTTEKDHTELESQRLNAVLQLSQKEWERAANSS
jgi:regulator of replication initiation timing